MSDEDDVDGMQDAGVALVRSYNYVSDEVDSQSAFETVISVSRPLTTTVVKTRLFFMMFNQVCFASCPSSSLPSRCLAACPSVDS